MAKVKKHSKRSRFNYRAPSADTLKKRSEGGGTRTPYLRKDLQIFKPKEDNNYVRILPASWKDAEYYGLDIWIHYDVGGEGAAYLCPAKMRNKKCPICEEAARSKNDEEYANSLRPGHRVLVYVIDRDAEDDGVKAWSMPPTIDRDLASLAVDKRTGEAVYIDDPEDGYDVEFERKGKGMKTKYTGLRIARKASPLNNDEALEFVEENPLPDMLKLYPYDTIKASFMGSGEDEEDEDEEEAEEEEEEETPRKKSKRPSRDEDEDEDEDEDDDEDEEEEEDEEDEKPAKRKSKAKRDADEDEDEEEEEEEEDDDADDDDDDDDDDDEEEDEAPRKKRRRR